MGRGRRRGRYRFSRREFDAVAPAVVEAIASERGRPVHWADLNLRDFEWPAVAAALEALRKERLIEYVGANSAAGRLAGFRLTARGSGWLALDREVRDAQPAPRNRARLSVLAES